MKRTDQQRKTDIEAARAHAGHYSFQQTFMAGMRYERRAMRKEMAEKLNALLAERKETLGPFHLQQCDGIRLAMTTLKIKEQK